MADWTYQIIDQSGKERKGNIVAESEAEAKNKTGRRFSTTPRRARRQQH